MMVDDQVKAVMAMKINAIFASGFKIEASGEEDADLEVAKFVTYCLEDGLESSNFKRNLMTILSALVYGFSVTEKIFKRFDSGDYKGSIGLKCLKTRPAHSFEFHTDEFNNLVRLCQNTNKGPKYFTEEDLKYFVIYSYHADNSGFDNMYGVSDLRAAYRPWFSKDMIIKFLNIYSERFGMGIVVGKYPKGLGQAELEQLKKMVKNLSVKTGFTIPEGVTFDILESAKQGQASFIETIKLYDAAIARSVLVPNLLGFTDINTGTYNLGEKHFDLFMMILDNIRSEMEELVNEQIIRDLVDYNYANITKYPYFKFMPLTEDDKQALSTLFISAVEKGVVLPTKEDEQYMRDVLNFPKRSDDAELLPRPQTGPATMPVVAPVPVATEGEQEGAEGDENKAAPVAPVTPVPNITADGEANAGVTTDLTLNGAQITAAVDVISKLSLGELVPVAATELLVAVGLPRDRAEIMVTASAKNIIKKPDTVTPPVPEPEKKFTLSRELTAHEKRVNFENIRKVNDGLQYDASKELSDLVAKIKDDLLNQIESKKIIVKQDFQAIENLKLDYLPDMRVVFRDILETAYTQGRKDILTEANSEKAFKTYAKGVGIGNLAPEKALEYFLSKRFFLTGTERDFILKNAKAILYDGLRSGKTNADIIYALDKFFDQYKVMQKTGAGTEQAINEIPSRLETVVRTQFNDAYNQGRLSMMQDEDVKDMIEAYQYSAINDDRITNICAELDQKIYKVNNPIWASILPPNHFNCRSIIIPVFKGEWDGKESEPPTVSLEPGFGG
jgi:SPP1 gp7 family putative phage head morphogenesis protein